MRRIPIARFNRPVGDQTMTPTFVIHSPGLTWENVPLSKIRSIPGKILFDWVFNDTEAYWSLPLREKPFLTTEESVHPAYAATTLDEMSKRTPPCRTSPKGMPIKRKSRMTQARETMWPGHYRLRKEEKETEYTDNERRILHP